jgi:hypothetical protein
MVKSAEELVRSFASRGITVHVRSDGVSRIFLLPTSAWASLSDEDRVLIGKWRDELKSLALSGQADSIANEFFRVTETGVSDV